MYSLGAIDTNTNAYTLPNEAARSQEYECMDCEQRVILKKGHIRRAHFAHFIPTTKCTYYEHPNESQLHKDAKYKLANLLANKREIDINWSCTKCNYSGGECEGRGVFNAHIYNYNDNDEVEIEYRSSDGKYIADVAILNAGKVKYIFEVKHTHKTITNVRPEPWFEFTANNILYAENESVKLGSNEIQLDCIRIGKNRLCTYCKGLECINEPFTENLPAIHKVGAEGNWKQTKECIKCKNFCYNPIYSYKQFRQICKPCFANNLDILKEEFAEQYCLIRF